MGSPKPPSPQRQCRSTMRGQRCPNMAQPGGKLCAEHAAARRSDDPAKLARSTANLELGRGKARDASRGRFRADPDDIARRIADIEEQVPVRDDAGNVPRGLRRLPKMAGRVEAELDWLAAKPALTARDERRRELLERRLDAYLERLGMSARAVLDYEPVRRRQELVAHRAVPSRDPDRARKVVGILMGSGVFGRAAMEFARERDPAGAGRDALFDDSEFEPLIDEPAETVEPPAEHIPEAAAPPAAALRAVFEPPAPEEEQ